MLRKVLVIGKSIYIEEHKHMDDLWEKAIPGYIQTMMLYDVSMVSLPRGSFLLFPESLALLATKSSYPIHISQCCKVLIIRF